MICISSTIGSGRSVQFQETGETILYNLKARLSHSELLDGTSFVLHSGTNVGDMTPNISADYEPTLWATLKEIHENDSTVLLSCKEGLFLAYIDFLSLKGTQIQITMRIQQRET